MKITPTCLTLVLALTTAAWGQFEQLVQDASLLEKTADTEEALPKVEPPVLSVPNFHKLSIRGMHQSADGSLLLSYDRKAIKVFEASRRAAIASSNEAPETWLGNSIILGAYFTGVEQQIVVITNRQFTGPNILYFENLDFTNPIATTQSSSSHAFDESTGLLYTGSFQQVTKYDWIDGVRHGYYGYTASLLRVDPRTYETELIYRETLPRGSIEIGRMPIGSLDPQELSIQFEQNRAFLGGDASFPVVVIDIAKAELIKTIPPETGFFGALPSGELITSKRLEKTFEFYSLDYDTLQAAPLFSHKTGSLRSWHRLNFPRTKNAALIVETGKQTTLLDPQTMTAVDLFKFHDRTDTAYRLQTNAGAQLLLATAKTESEEVKEACLNTVDLERGVFLRDWAAGTYVPDQLILSSDTYEFLAMQDGQWRSVKLTEAGVTTKEIRLPTGFSALTALPHPSGDGWRFIGDVGATIAEVQTDHQGTAYAASSLHGPESSAREIYYFASSRDQSRYALYESEFVGIYDVVNRQRIAEYPVETTFEFKDKQAKQMIALSPDGKRVAYVSRNIPVATIDTKVLPDGRRVSFYNREDQENNKASTLICREIASGEILWQRTVFDKQRSQIIERLRFSEDGKILYVNKEVNYATTGEDYFIEDTYFLGTVDTYNANNTLAVDRFKNIFSLPSGKKQASVADLGISRVSGFIGGDRFVFGPSETSEGFKLIDWRAGTVAAEIFLFDNLNKWLVRHPETGLFVSDQTTQGELYFVQENQISPLAAYFDNFYRPRLLGSMIQGLALRASVDINELRLAPKLSLKVDGISQRGLTVEDEFETFEVSENKVTLRLEATSEGSPIDDLRVYHNGKLVAGAARGLFVEDDEDAPEQEVFKKTKVETFDLTPGKNNFRAVAINAQGVESIPDEVIVLSAAASETAEAGFAAHIMIVGVNTYRNPSYNLNYARADAEAVQAVLTTNYEKIFARTELYTLYDSSVRHAIC
jgi:hypothetical protein